MQKLWAIIYLWIFYVHQTNYRYVVPNFAPPHLARPLVFQIPISSETNTSLLSRATVLWPHMEITSCRKCHRVEKFISFLLSRRRCFPWMANFYSNGFREIWNLHFVAIVSGWIRKHEWEWLLNGAKLKYYGRQEVCVIMHDILRFRASNLFRAGYSPLRKHCSHNTDYCRESVSFRNDNTPFYAESTSPSLSLSLHLFPPPVHCSFVLGEALSRFSIKQLVPHLTQHSTKFQHT